MNRPQPTHAPRTCQELGLCQAQFGRQRCSECDYEGDGNPLKLAPGVIDGPYRRATQADRALHEATKALESAKDALRLVAAYLMGPRP